MAEFTELVRLVHEVYDEAGGTYSEGTAPELMQVASAVYNDNQQLVRNTATEALAEAVGNKIVQELERRA